jgi:xylulokinase
MDCLMGIDLGSTSLKAVVYDTAGNVVSSGSRPTEKRPQEAAHPDWIVWRPEEIWGGTAAAVREAVGRLDDPRRIRAVAVTGMGQDGLPLDAEGRWLYPFISWHDQRTLPQFHWWRETIGLEKTFSVAGNPVWPINSALRVLWVREHEPDVYARTDKWLLIEDFLNFMLCGRRATDYSMASCWLLFDQRTLAWSDELLDLSGIERRILPEALRSGTPLGEVHRAAAEATGLAEGTPVVLGGHDHLCGALPVGAFEPGMALDVTGTWEIVMTPTTGPALDQRFRASGMTVQAHVAPGRHALWGAGVAGEMLEWYRAQFAAGNRADQPAAAGDEAESAGDDWQRLVEMAATAPPGCRGVMFLPHMSGASCPVVDERSRGAFVGLTPRATPCDLLRAIIEGLNYQLLDMLAAMEAGLGRRLERVVAVGGATRNRLWMQNKADVLGRPVEVPQIDEATPLGAAMLAGVGVGVYRDVAEAFERVRKPGGQSYLPDAARAALYAQGFEVYRELYPALRPISHRLHELQAERGS